MVVQVPVAGIQLGGMQQVAARRVRRAPAQHVELAVGREVRAPGAHHGRRERRPRGPGALPARVAGCRRRDPEPLGGGHRRRAAPAPDREDRVVSPLGGADEGPRRGERRAGGPGVAADVVDERRADGVGGGSQLREEGRAAADEEHRAGAGHGPVQGDGRRHVDGRRQRRSSLPRVAGGVVGVVGGQQRAGARSAPHDVETAEGDCRSGSAQCRGQRCHGRVGPQARVEPPELVLGGGHAVGSHTAGEVDQAVDDPAGHVRPHARHDRAGRPGVGGDGVDLRQRRRVAGRVDAAKEEHLAAIGVVDQPRVGNGCGDRGQPRPGVARRGVAQELSDRARRTVAASGVDLAAGPGHRRTVDRSRERAAGAPGGKRTRLGRRLPRAASRQQQGYRQGPSPVSGHRSLLWVAGRARRGGGIRPACLRARCCSPRRVAAGCLEARPLQEGDATGVPCDPRQGASA